MTFNETQYIPSIAYTISIFIQHPLQSVPGPRYGPTPSDPNNYFYVNENFIVLSYFVEKLSQMSLRDYYQQNIFNVIGMPNTLYDPWSQSFTIIPNPVSEYFYYTDLTQSTSPYAYGSCVVDEINPAAQAGSGGIISTVPDMVKWYNSLFISRNTSILTSASIDMILYPWSQSENVPGIPPQYYCLGVETQYANPPASPPAVADPPIAIYYMGGSQCTFFTIGIYNSTDNIFGGPSLVTLPIITVAARNNRILNVTQAEYNSVQQSNNGTWLSISNCATGGWGCADADLTDTELIAFKVGFYFAAMPFPGEEEAGKADD
jgi:hypothetical protein